MQLQGWEEMSSWRNTHFDALCVRGRRHGGFGGGSDVEGRLWWC